MKKVFYKIGEISPEEGKLSKIIRLHVPGKLGTGPERGWNKQERRFDPGLA